MVYNKLVRDKIPSAIEAEGFIPRYRILEEEEYRSLLEEKLDEEVGEFHRDQTPEELADILEVVLALSENIGCTREELWEIYLGKHEARGGFAKRVFLISKD